MTGKAIMRLVALSVASNIPMVVLERTTHLYRGPTAVGGVAFNMLVVICGRLGRFARALGSECLQHGHSSLDGQPVGLAQGTELFGKPGVADPCASLEELRTLRGRHELHAPAVGRVRPAGDETCNLQFVGKAGRGRRRQALDLGEVTNAERAVANHGGERGELGDGEVGRVHPAQLTGEADHRQPEPACQQVRGDHLATRARCLAHRSDAPLSTLPSRRGWAHRPSRWPNTRSLANVPTVLYAGSTDKDSTAPVSCAPPT
jgi:hypothetical protein